MSKTIKYTLIIVVLVVAAFFGSKAIKQENDAENISGSKESSSGTSTSGGYTFQNPKKSAHYESNTPAHGAVLAGAPVNVVIDFNFDLAKPSSISVVSDGKEYGVGEVSIDSNKLSMRRNIGLSSPDGLYTVNYNACWPDGSCHEGSFQFAIDRKKVATLTDMRDQNEVTIHMADIKFKPSDIRVSKGTKVTWVNDEGVDHYVNTDSHPAHTFLPGMNSRSLAQGASYSYVFGEAGLYPYHCSAHAENMTGNILVE